MRPQKPWPAVVLALLALIGGDEACAQISLPPPIANVEAGVLEGTRFGAGLDEVAFLGVPYAVPPIGELRWRPPNPVRRWSGTRSATQFGAACPQLPAGWLEYPVWSEDCLTLNIWTTNFPGHAKSPVIVYFHGGGNSQGYSQFKPVGPALARLGTVVVSANYRLGPLGFLAHPALTAESQHHSSGNYGLLDQLLVLRWVKRNIGRFGGDPRAVTVMGQSSGAVDICLLMSSPLAAHLFHRAILQSGDCQGELNEDIRTPIPYNSISGTGESSGEQLAFALGVTDQAHPLPKLRSIPAADIMKAWSANKHISFDAIVDGWVIPEQPAWTFAAGKQARVPILAGSNADEATVLGLDVTTVEQYRNYLEKDAREFANEELQAWPVASDADVPARYLELQNDGFAYGAWSMVRATARAKQHAYLYCFGYAESGKRAPLGAHHGIELNFLSDTFPDDWKHDDDDAALGRVMRQYWAQFAKTGNPNLVGLPPWPEYDKNSDQCLELNRTIRLRASSKRLQDLDRINHQIFAAVETHSGVH
jgi:para-nitrobenzyl esterase